MLTISLQRLPTTTTTTQRVSWLVILFYSVSTLLGSFNAELSHFDKSLKYFSLV